MVSVSHTVLFEVGYVGQYPPAHQENRLEIYEAKMTRSSIHRAKKRFDTSSMSQDIDQLGVSDLAGRAFKFFNSKHLKNVKRGEIRIGTLDSFRADDGFDDGRADRNEGVANWTPEVGAVLGKGHPLRDILLEQYHRSIRTQEFDEKFELRVTSAELSITFNAYVICFSKHINDDLCYRMYSRFGYDMYYEISSMRSYLSAIMKHFPVGSKAQMAAINYCDPPDGPDFVADPFTKRPTFRWQDEIRIVIPGRAATPFTLLAPNTKRLVQTRKNPMAPAISYV
jgi:hypothetical protein